MTRRLLETFTRCREGRRLLGLAQNQGIDIILDRQMESGSACFLPKWGVIALSAQDENALLVSVLAHELRHIQQFSAGLIPSFTAAAQKVTSPERYIILSRMTEADASAFQTLFARQHHRETGDENVIRAARYWSFFRAGNGTGHPAKQMLDTAESFLASPHYWRQYGPRYQAELELLAKTEPQDQATTAVNTGVAPEDIRRFGRLETTLEGVMNYLDGAGDNWLGAKGFLTLPCGKDGRPEADALKICHAFRHGKNPPSGPRRRG